MPKLNIDKSFINKLNSINRERLNPNKKIEKKESKFKITDDKTPFMPSNPFLSNPQKPLSPQPQAHPEIHINQTPTLLPNINDKTKNLLLKRLVLENITETGMMWDSFDDSIKKIVLSEIIEKYYLYKVWKINTVSFIIGFLLALCLIIVIYLILYWSIK